MNLFEPVKAYHQFKSLIIKSQCDCSTVIPILKNEKFSFGLLNIMWFFVYEITKINSENELINEFSSCKISEKWFKFFTSSQEWESKTIQIMKL